MAVSEALLIGFVLMPLPAVLWPRRVGHYYLRYHLSRRGVRKRQIPSACVREFVDDALHYSRTVSTRPSHRAFGPRIPDFEFERMLRIHCCVVHALLSGKAAAEAGDETLIRELIRSEMLRAGVEPSRDVAACQRIEHEVRTGKCWDRHRAILSRYELAHSSPRAAIGQLTQ